MDEQTFHQLATEARQCLTQGHLRDALLVLETLTLAVGNSTLTETRNMINANYDRLLQFMQTGGEDQSRSQVYTHLTHRTAGLLQNLRRAYRLQKGKDIYSTTCQHYSTPWEEGVQKAFEALPAENGYDTIDGLFDLIWTSPQFTGEAVDFISHWLEDDLQPDVPCYLLSALTLSLLEYFDPHKIRLLLNYCQSTDTEKRARALVAICIASQIHAPYISLYPDIVETFDQLQLTDEMAHVQHMFCIYQESERMQQRMQEEILPDLIRAHQQSEERTGQESAELNLSDPNNGIDRRTRQRLTASLREMASLYQDGMDLTLDTFSGLKAFPFFLRPCHWLAPYGSLRPEARDLPLTHTTRLCDSDKYSVSLLFNILSLEGQQKLEEQMNKQLSQGQDEGGNEEEQRTTPQVYHNVMHCLYRLLKRSPWSTEWPVVFSPQMVLLNTPILSAKLENDAAYLRRTGNTFLRYKHYTEAYAHLLRLLQLDGGTAHLYRALALCQEQLGEEQKAINYYRQATLLEPQHKETLHKLQACLGRLQQHEAQLDVLLELEQLAPEDPQTLTLTGLCLMALQRWKEAQQRFFRLKFNNQRVLPSLRAIAWCALQQHDLTQARRYYQRIFDDFPTSVRWEDYLNLGHTAWLSGDVHEALSLYRQYVPKYLIEHSESRDALAPFDADSPTLLRLGLSPTDLNIMHDLIASTL